MSRAAHLLKVMPWGRVIWTFKLADAHETFDESLQRLQDIGFDTASVNQGYGKALDFVMDVVIEAFVNINQPISRILAR